MKPERAPDDPLNIEGLAAQLYTRSHGGGHVVWGHVLSEEFRKHARQQIADFVALPPGYGRSSGSL
jgi:hypothetical protein